jgi:hypothetical protein
MGIATLVRRVWYFDPCTEEIIGSHPAGESPGRWFRVALKGLRRFEADSLESVQIDGEGNPVVAIVPAFEGMVLLD